MTSSLFFTPPDWKTYKAGLRPGAASRNLAATCTIALSMSAGDDEGRGWTFEPWRGRVYPDGLTMVEQPPAKPTPRDVFLYVISGFKPANPAAAMALMERLSR